MGKENFIFVLLPYISPPLLKRKRVLALANTRYNNIVLLLWHILQEFEGNGPFTSFSKKNVPAVT